MIFIRTTSSELGSTPTNLKDYNRMTCKKDINELIYTKISLDLD